MKITKNKNCVINKNHFSRAANTNDRKRSKICNNNWISLSFRILLFRQWKFLAPSIERFYLLIQISHVDFFSSSWRSLCIISMRAHRRSAEFFFAQHLKSADPESVPRAIIFPAQFSTCQRIAHRSDIELITARRIDRSELAWSSTWFPISLRESISLNIVARNVCTFNYRLFLYHHKNAIKAATESSEMERRTYPDNETSLSPRSKITFFSSDSATN